MEGLFWLMIYRHHGREIMQQEQGRSTVRKQRKVTVVAQPSFSFHSAKTPAFESRLVNI